MLGNAVKPKRMKELFSLCSLCIIRTEEIVQLAVDEDISLNEIESTNPTIVSTIHVPEPVKSPKESSESLPLIPTSKLLLLQSENLYNIQILSGKIDDIRRQANSSTSVLLQMRTMIEDLRMLQTRRMELDEQGLLYLTANFLDLDAREVAQQLTLIDHSIFCKIHPRELANSSWNKPEKREKAPGITASIDFFNFVTSWVQFEILKEDEALKRAKIFTHFIKISIRLMEYASYNMLKALMSGLSSSCILRLKETNKLISEKIKTSFENLQSMVSEAKNFGYLRAVLEKRPSPSIPFLGLYLRVKAFLIQGPHIR